MTTRPSEPMVEIKKHITRKCGSLGIPCSGIFEITPRCNLKCKMCYVRMTPRQMAPIGRERTAQEWLSFGKECVDAGMVFLLITGGEPMLRKDFCEIYEGLAGMGLSISINTNGTILSEEIRALWKKLPPSQVNITLYGTCKEDYEALCGDGSAYDRVCDALDWLDSENILVHLNTTITPVNYPKFDDIEEFAKKRGLDLRPTSYCFPPTRRDGCSICSEFTRLEPEAAGELIVRDILFREGMNAVKYRAVNLSERAVQKSCDLDNGEPMACAAGKSQFWVTWNGNVTPCGMIDTPAFPAFDEGFAASWDKLRVACSEIRLCPECACCEYAASCMNCAAVTYAETGRFDGKPEYMCKLNMAYREAVTRVAQLQKDNTKTE